MQTVWHGVVNAKRPGKIREWRYDNQNIVLKKGEEMGRFLLGSTVIMTFPKRSLAFNPAWEPAKPVRLGEEMANYGR
jgi:phosphatidylserine decarboxylase